MRVWLAALQCTILDEEGGGGAQGGFYSLSPSLPNMLMYAISLCTSCTVMTGFIDCLMACGALPRVPNTLHMHMHIVGNRQGTSGGRNALSIDSLDPSLPSQVVH